MYKTWYSTSPKGEKELRDCLNENPAGIADVRKRLNEVKAIPRDRCIISAKLADFLERVLNDYKS